MSQPRSRDICRVTSLSWYRDEPHFSPMGRPQNTEHFKGRTAVEDCKCAHCNEIIEEGDQEWKEVTKNGTIFNFCSYLCLLRFMGRK